jgi:hypothetical protein
MNILGSSTESEQRIGGDPSETKPKGIVDFYSRNMNKIEVP